MKARASFNEFTLLFALFLASAAPQSSSQQANTKGPTSFDFTVVKPESVGFSSERLERLHALMQQEVDQKQLPGVITILARHGKIVDYHTYGDRDVASGAPMTKDTIFRVFSMSKPITGVAMMLLTSRASGCRQIPSGNSFRNSRTSRCSRESTPREI